MEECEILDSEGPELQELMSQDDDDEVEELHNSLREVVQDQSVKPKFQCLMVDASFSMVTVQSEDSGIVWETASSRCSTPWASETSSTSEAYSMDGSGAAGKITIVFDEDKIVRKRTRSGRSSRLGDRLSRPGSSRSASALGVERPEMAEISLPNVKLDKTETEPDLEEIRNKDQQLFSLISEGYEILNIRVPSKLPTVDEEESTELQDNLSYLDQTPKIRSGNRNDWSLEANPALPKEGELLDDQKTLKRDSSADTPSQKESPGDIDYFEKFTLVDVVVPGERAPESQEDAEQPQAKHNAEEQKPAKEADRNSPSASDDSFVFVTDVDIAGEHLDEVFYGAGASADALQQRGEDEADSGTRRRRPSHRSLMENGSRLFGAEDTVLTPIFLSPGPPKIIDQILLDEPTAMSFMYSDLYEDAVGERRKSDEERSEAESMASEKTYQRRLSDSDEADGYLEKFILKDETSTVEVQPDPVEETREGRMMWSQSKFDMTGCLTRVTTEDDEDKSKTEDPEPREVSVGDASDNSQSATSTGRREIITEPKKEMKEIQVSTVTEGEAAREASHNSTEASTLREDQMEVQGVKRGGKSEAPVSSIDKPLNDTQKADGKVEKAEESTEHPAEVAAETTSVVETEQPRGAQMVLNAAGETSVAAPVSSEAPHITDISLSNEAARDTETTASHGKDFTEAAVEASAAAKQMETSAEISVRDKNEAAEVVPGDVLSFEVIAECDSAVQAIVEVIEKTVDETEIRTEVQIDLQEAISVETTADEPGVLAEAAAVEGKSPTLITEGYQETEVEAEILNEVTESAMLVKKDSDKWQILNSESMQHQQEEPVTDSEIINKATEDTGNVTQEKVHMDDELVLLVPKGQAVEMDIEISQLSQKTTSGPEAVSEPDRLTAPETSTRCHESLRAPTDQTGTRPRLEVTPDAVLKEDTLSIHQADSGFAPPAAEEGACADTPKARSDFEEVEGDFLSPRSLTPQEDLSESHSEDRKSGEADAEQKAEIHNEGDAPETRFVTQHSGKEIDEHREDVEPKMEPDQVAAEATEVSADGLEYEIISKQDAEGMPEPDTQRNVEEPILECGQERDERMEMEEEEEEEKVLDDEFIEADYEIIDAEEESQARLAAELQQMDRFCVTCGCLLSEDDCVSGEHHHHEVAALDQAYEAIKEKLSDWISELQGRSENIEDLVSELELAYNSVEDQCVESEAAMQAQNEETKALVMEQYNDMSVSMEEEKKAKLEQLYDQIVALQEGIDTAKATLETTAREAETDARSPEDINARIKATLDSAMSLELGPKGLLVFEDYARGNGSSSHLAQRKGIPVPQRPTLQPQETGLATSTSVTVYWKVNPGDIIDCFQVYCMEDPQGASTAVSEEYRVTVKESYCALEELEPDKTYKVWVMAVNYTGCSLPSERLSFTTAPSVPAIETERCTVTWDSATLRWSSAHQTPEQSYTLEYCRQYELEGEGLRSISGIKSCEQRVLLQPNESYLFYIKAVNACGASEQSEAALISTKGTRFHLLKASAHPALELSADRTVVHYDAPSADNQCPSILGELLPARGRYYWETLVSGSTAYRLGAAYAAADGNSPLGENHLSWCLRCIPTPSGCRYQLLHKDILSSMFVMEVPERVGTLLDHQLGRLSFYNARSGQLLGTFCQQFTRLCHPALALEGPGSLEVRMVPEVPEFTKHS